MFRTIINHVRNAYTFTPNQLRSTSPRLGLDDLVMLGHHFRRNFLPNDDSATQKTLVANWQNNNHKKIGYKELLESGFRVYSQNDEDGILLRIFAQIESTNKYIIEIGSNCSGSEIEIPENLSTNLIVNHGWHGTIFEIDETECARMRYFFARHLSTKHFHWIRNGENKYYSPRIIQKAVDAENINVILSDGPAVKDPDLMIIDIDGGDYAVMRALNIIQPRVLVVEFEKRFRDTFSVVQFKGEDFSKEFQQSGTASLPAWEKLLISRGYILCAINFVGLNAFFIRADVAVDKIFSLRSKEAFDFHPIFSNIEKDFWLTPNETWQEV